MRIRSACRAVVISLLVLVPLIGFGQQAGPIASPLAITHVIVIDTHTGAIQPDMTVLIREGRIANIGPATALTVTPEEASDAGQLIEHTETLFEGTFAAALGQSDEPLLAPRLPDAIRDFRARGAESLFARFSRNRTSVTPTLRIMRSLLDPDRGLGDPRLRYVPRSLREAARKSEPLSSEQRAALARLHAESREVVRMMSEAGVVLLAGTDTATAPAVPGGSFSTTNCSRSSKRV